MYNIADVGDSDATLRQLTDLPCLHILLVATAACGYFSTNYVMLLTALPAVSKMSIPIAWWK